MFYFQQILMIVPRKPVQVMASVWMALMTTLVSAKMDMKARTVVVSMF